MQRCTPMDYDENDFQNQNHHIAGENNKLTLVLNPCPLPKFEFEDSLQDHVRFDSLAESEVFLGIESNEDNRWIEDFSRGSCGIDFSKSAAEPCSISHCNNVWSDATSSESVEMLLKSVRQEETIPGQSITEVSDAFDDLGCSTKRMEPNVCHEAMFSEMHYVGGLQPSLSPKNSSSIENDIRTTQSPNDVSLQSNHGKSIESYATNLDVNTDGKLEILAEGHLCDGETCYDASGKVVRNMCYDSVISCAKEEKACSAVEVADIVMEGENFITEDKLKSQEGPHPSNNASLNDENKLQQDSSLLCGELITLENKNGMNNNNYDCDKIQSMDGFEINIQKSDINLVRSMNSHPKGAAHLCSSDESIMEENTGRTVKDNDQACTHKDVPQVLGAFPEMHDVGVLQPSLSPKNSSSIENNIGKSQSQNEVSLQSNHGESIENDVANLDVDAYGKLEILAEGYLYDGETCYDASGRDVSNMGDDSVKSCAEEEMTCSAVEVHDIVMDSENLIIEDKSKSQEGPHPSNDASLNDENNLQQDSNLLDGELITLENKNGVNNDNYDCDKIQYMDGDEINLQKSDIDLVQSMNSHPKGAAPLCSSDESIMEENTGRTVKDNDQACTYKDVPQILGAFPEMHDVGGLQPSLSPKNSSSIENDIGTNQSPNEVRLQSNHSESIENDVTNLDVDTYGKLEILAEGYLCDGETCYDASGRDVSNMGVGSVKSGAEEEMTCSAVEVDDAVMDSENFIIEDKLKSQEGPHPSNEKNLHQDTNLLGGELITLENKNEVNNDSYEYDKIQNVDGDEINQQKSDINLFQSMKSHLKGDAHLCSSDESIKEENTGRTIKDNDQACMYKDVPDNDASASDQLSETVHMELPALIESNMEIDGHQVEKVVSYQQDDDSCLQKDHVDEKHTFSDGQLIAGGSDGKPIPSSCTMEEKVSNAEDDGGRPCHSVYLETNNIVADTMGSSKIVCSMEKSNGQSQDLPSAQARTTETEEASTQVNASNPESVSDHQEDSTVFLPEIRNENETICIPAVKDEDFPVSSVGKPGIVEDGVDDHKADDNLAEAVLHPIRLEVEDDADVELRKRDMGTQLSDSHVAAEEGHCSESVQGLVAAQHASNEQCMGMSISESTAALENDSPIGLHESKTAEARVILESDNTLKVAENLLDVTHKVENCDEATITPEKSRVSIAQEKCETEPSGDVSKAIESFLFSKGSLPESQEVLDVTEDGRDHCDADGKNSGTQIVEGNDSLSLSEKEIGKSLVFTVQGVGITGAEAQDGKDEPHVLYPKEINMSKAEKSYTFEFMEASASASGPVHAGSEIQQIVSKVNLQMDNKENRRSKGNLDRKSMRPSIKSARRESAKKGSLGKDVHPMKELEQTGKSSDVPLVPSGIYQLLQPNDMLHNRQMEGFGISPIGAISTPASSLPDLNSSAFPSMVFQQPFNDLQQVQLRAQILVYGSLISRVVPEELHMLSAFGGSDGGRSMWEKSWKTCNARVCSQTPGILCSDTPTSSQSDMVSDPTSKQFAVTPSASRHSSTIGTPTVSINPMIPLASPLWSLPTPPLDILQSKGMARSAAMDYQPVFPQLAPNRIQPILSYAGHNATWMSQSSLHSPWVASPQTPAVNTNIPFPSLALCSATKQAPPGPSAQSGVHAGATAVVPPLDLAKVIVQPGQPSSDPKSKKRKKCPHSEDLSSTMESQSLLGKSSVPSSVSGLKASAVAATPDSFRSKCTTLEFDALSSLVSSISTVKEADPVKKKIVISEEVNEIKKAKEQADNAAALAAAAVSHSQEVWNGLDKKRISGSISVLEAKLSFAAVAVSTAAAVSKAAYMAANLASNVALQSKAMADEALNDDCCCNSCTMEGSLRSDGRRVVSSSIILATKEASRRRVEAASAAAFRAENLDMIVQASELAAKAISQAGKVITFGDPSSLGKLAEAGPEGFWELPQSSFEFASMVQDANTEQESNKNIIAGSNGPMNNIEGLPDKGATYFNQNVPSSVSKDILTYPIESHRNLIVGTLGTLPVGIDRTGEMLPTTSDTTSKICESRRASGEKGDNGIREGTRVEVFKYGAWFPADVISLDDGKAYVHYTELLSAEGSGKLQEWVEIEGADYKAPKIRIPHPMTAMQFDGSRKRQRAAIGSTCSVGDKVDAWIQDRWLEGVVLSKSEKDVMSITVHLPAIGKTSVVKTWQLRPALIWKDGKWIEALSREDHCSHQMGDTPKGKRAKLGSSGNRAKVKDKVAMAVVVPDSGKPEGSKLLCLSAKDKAFDIGKSDTELGKPDFCRIIHSGLRKNGQGVIFGVPKPGKKRKFMEVSKHYVVDQSNRKTQVHNSVKTPNYMMPRGTGPRGLRNAPRCDVKEDKASELKTKAPAAVKSRGLSGRIASKESSTFRVSALGVAPVTDRHRKMKDSSGHVVKHNLVGNSSFASSEVAIGGSFTFSSGAPSDATAPKSDSFCKGKPTSAGGNMAKLENQLLNSNSQAEPRRSNRKIQPTSRLLEGLQTSSLNLKVPSSLLDKGHRSVRGGDVKGKN
ncbi:hypothetical protein SAY86_001150 [Trapa natans]|uniref:Agenet domain-containing protein n=1 Tax=Trapa natans TaxID=22666 RepID=A0AAN7MD76_TRANT|nr:hypothetical protein SAY86_001150 [Trapa natans]